MSRFSASSWIIAIGLSSVIHLAAIVMMPKAPKLDDELASGQQVAVSVAVAAANAFPTPDSNAVTEPSIEATAAEAEEPIEPVPNQVQDAADPEMNTATQATAASEPAKTATQPTQVESKAAPSTTVQVARVADEMSRAQRIESTSTAAPAESASTAETVESSSTVETEEGPSTAEPVDNTNSAKPVNSPSTAKPVETIESAKPVVKSKKKQQKKKKATARKKTKKAKRRAKKNSSARRSASSRRNGANSSNAGSRGKSSRAAGRAKLASYLGRVKSKIRRQNRGAKASGVSVVAFSIGGSGSVSRVRLKRSSGNATLDKAAVRMVRRAAPFGPIPPDVGRRKLSLSVPIRFRLR